MKYKIFIFFLILIALSNTYAQRGKDGNKVISSAGVIVNEYTSLLSDAVAGTTTLNVLNNNLNTNNRFSANLAAGDLIMIIQVQGVIIESSINSKKWGEIINYDNCGLYEYAEILSVPSSNVINLVCGLVNNYSVSGKVEIIRVPRYQSLTINNNGVLTGESWNGATGGILALEILGNTVINSGGKIDNTGKGFRGGILNENDSYWGVDNYIWLTSDYGAEKGEGIAGNITVYDGLGGRYCRGAAANAGGGANAHNCGGGGGANAGDTSLWKGTGNPDISNTSWITAWNLEGAGFANSTSSGGGRGGYSFSSQDEDALVIGTHDVSGSTAWGGDARNNNGGLGGRPLDYSTGRIFMGGGGGAGDQNDLMGSSGSNGGGIILVQSYGSISGNGQIQSNGDIGINSTSGSGIFGSGGADGAGGAGAGGAIILKSTGNISGISVFANGGSGGNQVIASYYNFTQSQAEGPGGGGGGGYIAVSNGSITKQANGGANGTTNSSGLDEFPPNGATKGGAGINNALANIIDIVAIGDTVCPGDFATLSASLVGTVSQETEIIWYDSQVGGNILGTGPTYTTAALSNNTNFYVGFCPGSFRTLIGAVVNNPAADAGTNAQICNGGSVTLNASGGILYQWFPAIGLNSTNIYNPIASPQTTTSYYVSVTNTYGCIAVDSVIVSIGSLAANAGNDVSVCNGGSTQLQASGGTIYSWMPTAGLSNSNIFDPVATPLGTTTYIVTITDGSICSDLDTVIVTVLPVIVANAGADDTICPGGSIQLNAGGGTVYNWFPATDLDATDIYNPVSTPYSTITYTVTVSDDNGCSATDNITVNVIQSVSAAFSFSSVCYADSVVFTDVSASAAGNIINWNWNFGDGSSISTSQNPHHLYNAAGSYEVKLVVSNDIGCSDSLIQIITVNDSPLPAFNKSDTVGCAPLSISFSDITSIQHTRLWDFGNPISGQNNTSTIQNPTHVFTQVGTYYVKLKVTSASGSCSDSIIQAIHVYPKPDAQFTESHNPVDVNSVVTFNNTSTDASIWNWNFGNGQTSNVENPTTLFSYSGYYTVTLLALNAWGCFDTASISINVAEDADLYFPNVFTPNNDRLNDLFEIINIEKHPSNHLYIYNRWGKLVYNTENYQNDWDGGDYPDGVYYFVLFYSKNKEIHGAITILR
ncbi:MAG: PKD domain-containing protein [Bacteroidetes bacterium]|nr:PKD domain-containing protein [Bacteroidota bacterium]